jgi:MFS transporter, DHA2 family, multidrug resistance protein
MSQLKKIIIILTTISAAIMELIDTSIVNVALNNISGNLGATLEDTSWVITAYAIANVIIIPMTGFLAKYFGRKNYYIASIILFTVASYLCGQASSLPLLVLWRFVQGIGGGALLSTSQGILFDLFPPEKRGQGAALFGMGIILGPTIGPLLGGWIVVNASWPDIFYINIPFGIVATLLTIYFIDRKPEEYAINRSTIRIDYLGIFLLTIGIGSLQYVLEKGESEDWFESKTILYLTLTAIVGLGSFIWQELTSKNPVIDLRVLKSRNLVASNLLNFVCGFGLFGSVFIFPVLVQRILGYTALDAGLGLVPGAIAAICCMPIIGKRLGAGTQPIVFVVVGFISFFLHGYLSSIANADAARSFFIIPQIFRGIGTACLIIPLTNQAVVGLQPKEMPYGIALTNMLRQLGGAFGIAVMNTYVAGRYVAHRTALVSNLQANNTEWLARQPQYTMGAVSRGVNPIQAQEMSFKLLDLAVTKQGYLMAYLDGFILISIFFVCATPLLFLLKTKKVDAQLAKKLVAEAH